MNPIVASAPTRQASRLTLRRLSTCLVTAVGLVAAAAHAQSNAANLQARWIGHTYFLRSLCSGSNLRFAADGAPVGDCPREPFTLGLLKISKIDVTSFEIKIKAHRVGLVFRDDVPMEVELAGGSQDTVTLHFAAQPAGDPSLVLLSVLTNQPSDLLPNIPAAWRPFFQAHIVSPKSAPQQPITPQTAQQDNRPVSQEEVDRAQINPVADDAVASDSERTSPAKHRQSDAPVHLPDRAGKDGVSAPRVIRQRDASFSPEARALRYPARCIIGLVVDEQGNPGQMWVAKPAGLGLDEQALSAVSHYKFEPARRNGQPVPVVMNVEVSFDII